MKVYFLLFCLGINMAVKAQASAECYNSGISTMASETESEKLVSVTAQNSLILMPYVMKEPEVLLIIKEKNNSELNRLLKKVKLSKTFQNIGFAAIPEALVGGGLIGVAAASNKGNLEQKAAGVGLLALGAVCLSSSLFFKIKHTKNYKKAIKKYNQLYN